MELATLSDYTIASGARPDSRPNRTRGVLKMRFRNLWFDLTTFLFSMLLLGTCAFSVIDYFWAEDASLGGGPVLIGILLFLAGLFFWTSLRIGDHQRRRREIKRKDSAQECV